MRTTRRVTTAVLVLALAVGCASSDEAPHDAPAVAVVAATGPVRVTDLACQTSLSALRTAAATYHALNGRWPTRIGDLASLVRLDGRATLSADGATLSGVGWTASITGDGTTEPRFVVTGATNCR